MAVNNDGLLIIDVLQDNVNELSEWSANNNDDYLELITDIETKVEQIKTLMIETEKEKYERIRLK